MPERAVVLGVESSCDETSCAVVVNGREVLSNIVASQIDMHSRFGGVVPEIASRAHIEAVNTVIQEAMDKAGVAVAELSAVGVTHEPGLIGSLLIGLMAAKTLAWIWDVPLVGVNHVYAHAYAANLQAEPVQYPAVALICSGGHTALYHCHGPTEMTLLGTTIDDAAGEAFDKVASVLNLGYPGGPIVDRIARAGNPEAVRFPRSLLSGQSLDFSFSGIKTAVLYHVNGVPGARKAVATTEVTAGGHGVAAMSQQEIADVAASFQAAVVDVLKTKVRRAVKQTAARSIIIGGGVAANTALRQGLAELAEKLRVQLRMPEFRFCLDNAAMTAGLAYHLLREGKTSGLDLDARATVKR